jgi:signal transduction histidine kinase
VLTPPGPLEGPVGLGLLAIALAALCGGAAFTALRAAGREAATTRLRAEFLTNVTHELKTPLAGIRLAAELLADNRVRGGDEQRAWLARLSAEAARLGMLIENVLDLGRVERGERAHAPERVDLAAIAREAVALFQPLADRDGVEVRCEAGEVVEAVVDPGAWRQALSNLLDNARKYAAGGRRIEVVVERAGDSAVVRVRDFGPGIDAAERAVVFERFRRGSRHRDGAIPGVGLGLHLARSIAQQNGGELACVMPADGGRGACFELRCPAALAKDPA